MNKVICLTVFIAMIGFRVGKSNEPDLKFDRSVMVDTFVQKSNRFDMPLRLKRVVLDCKD